MITYKYKAVDKDGKSVSGEIQALDEFDAVQKIRSSYPIIEEVKEQTAPGNNLLAMEIGSNKVPEKELSVMCSQFYIMLKSGFPLSRCVDMIAKQTKDKRLKSTLESVSADVEQGSSLADSFERSKLKFPLTFTETIRAGEQSGTVEDSFKRMEVYYEQSYQNTQKVKQAMTYPAFVIVIAVVVLFVVMVKVIPVLAETFDALGGDLPLMTKMMIAMSNFFVKYWFIMAFVLVALVLAVNIYKHSAKGRLRWGALQLHMPVMGNINTYNCAAQFADTMQILIGSGFSVNRGMEVTGRVISNDLLADECFKMSKQIEEGKTLASCMRESGQFPDNLVEMCAIGEESGELDQTLTTVSAYYHNEADHAVTQFLNKLEPTITVGLAIFAGFIVISIYLPMFTMYNYM